MDGDTERLIHGTAVALGERTAIIIGPSGSGKSDLALRCLFLPQQSTVGHKIELVADDQVQICLKKENVYACAPANLAGRLEVRGLGIINMPYKVSSRVCLLVQLTKEMVTARLPDPWPHEILLGCYLPVFQVNPFEASAPNKLALALAQEPWLST